MVGFKSLNFFEILNSNCELCGAVELSLTPCLCVDCRIVSKTNEISTNNA